MHGADAISCTLAWFNQFNFGWSLKGYGNFHAYNSPGQADFTDLSCTSVAHSQDSYLSLGQINNFSVSILWCRQISCKCYCKIRMCSQFFNCLFLFRFGALCSCLTAHFFFYLSYLKAAMQNVKSVIIVHTRRRKTNQFEMQPKTVNAICIYFYSSWIHNWISHLFQLSLGKNFLYVNVDTALYGLPCMSKTYPETIKWL